jgi:GNAT superfamily N-acetyltransferase
MRFSGNSANGTPRTAGFDLSRLVASPVAAFTADQVASAFNSAFDGYLVPLRFTAQSYERRMRGENLDPYASHIYLLKRTPVALILVARRGWTSRVAAMAIAPPFREQGLGGRMLFRVIDEAKKRGDRRILLEVIEGNRAATQLYINAGFRVLRRLVGFTRKSGVPAEEARDILQEVDPGFVANLLLRQEGPDWPWNIAPQTLAALAPPSRAFALDDAAFAIVSPKDEETMVLNAILVAQTQRRRGFGGRLLDALYAQYPGRDWVFTPLIPEGLTDNWFLKNRWIRYPIKQLEMELPLPANAASSAQIAGGAFSRFVPTDLER